MQKKEWWKAKFYSHIKIIRQALFIKHWKWICHKKELFWIMSNWPTFNNKQSSQYNIQVFINNQLQSQQVYIVLTIKKFALIHAALTTELMKYSLLLLFLCYKCYWLALNSNQKSKIYILIVEHGANLVRHVEHLQNVKVSNTTIPLCYLQQTNWWNHRLTQQP